MPERGEIRPERNAGRVRVEGVCVAFLEREEFVDVLKREEEPVVVCCLKGTLRNRYTYVTCYRGMLFAHRGREPIALEGYELINAEEIRFYGRRL